ncbi:MAG: hypothetical protein FWF12_00075 [Betaproteobacteria bacterium]|nr:hypothetical protein [Betaproteobacteria bacterium]
MPKIVSRRRHERNGKFYGLWLEFDSGEKLYVAYRKGVGLRTTGYFQKTNSWCIDTMTLNHATATGVKWIAVIHDVGKGTRHYYSTPIEDFYGPRSGVHSEGSTRQRFLPRAFWLNNPYTDPELIEKKVKIAGRVARKI